MPEIPASVAVVF